MALLGWAVTSSLAVFPHSLAYFNELAGGPEQGHNHLLFSNLDWGQDLLFLKRWLAEHPEARPLGLAYQNDLDPAIFGLAYPPPPPGPNGLFLNDLANRSQYGPQAGYYAVSVQLLRDYDTRYAYFRQFEPIARAGYSIYIYHITPEQADALWRLMELPPPHEGSVQ